MPVLTFSPVSLTAFTHQVTVVPAIRSTRVWAVVPDRVIDIHCGLLARGTDQYRSAEANVPPGGGGGDHQVERRCGHGATAPGACFGRDAERWRRRRSGSRRDGRWAGRTAGRRRAGRTWRRRRRFDRAGGGGRRAGGRRGRHGCRRGGGPGWRGPRGGRPGADGRGRRFAGVRVEAVRARGDLLPGGLSAGFAAGEPDPLP